MVGCAFFLSEPVSGGNSLIYRKITGNSRQFRPCRTLWRPKFAREFRGLRENSLGRLTGKRICPGREVEPRDQGKFTRYRRFMGRLAGIGLPLCGINRRSRALSHAPTGTELKLTGQQARAIGVILDDYSRYIIAWKLCTTMKAADVPDTLELALHASGCVNVQRPRLLLDNGACYVACELAAWLDGQGMEHTRGSPCHPHLQEAEGGARVFCHRLFYGRAQVGNGSPIAVEKSATCLRYMRCRPVPYFAGGRYTDLGLNAPGQNHDRFRPGSGRCSMAPCQTFFRIFA